MQDQKGCGIRTRIEAVGTTRIEQEEEDSHQTSEEQQTKLSCYGFVAKTVLEALAKQQI